MNLTTNEIIVIAVAVVAVLLIIAAVVMYVRRKRHRDELKRRHGAEYGRTVERLGSERRAEEQLNEREARRQRFEVRELSSGERATFRGRFEAIEASFVDGPEAAVRAADSLLDEIAECRGYPEAPADERLDDLSVDHPAAVDRYRTSRTAPDPDGGSVTTEQHRQALLGRRALFDALVGRNPEERADAPPTFRDLIGNDGDEHQGNGHRRRESARR